MHSSWRSSAIGSLSCRCCSCSLAPALRQSTRSCDGPRLEGTRLHVATPAAPSDGGCPRSIVTDQRVVHRPDQPTPPVPDHDAVSEADQAPYERHPIPGKVSPEQTEV